MDLIETKKNLRTYLKFFNKNIIKEVFYPIFYKHKQAAVIILYLILTKCTLNWYKIFPGFIMRTSLGMTDCRSTTGPFTIVSSIYLVFLTTNSVKEYLYELKSQFK